MEERGAAKRISVCLIVKDEEPCIERCLQSVRPFAAELLVADTGSSDRTPELAARYADRVLRVRWRDDFSAARNFCADAAENDWILTLDADETVAEWDETRVARRLERPEETGLARVVSEVQTGGETRHVSEWMPRLYNRRFYRYEGAIHEQLARREGGAPCGGGAPREDNLPRRADAGIALSHSGYSAREVERKHKAERNIALLTRALEQKPNDCYLLYQLGRGYELAKDAKRARACYERALPLIPDVSLAYARGLFTACGYARINTGDPAGAAALGRFGEAFSQSPDFLFMLAYADMLCGRFDEAVRGFLRCAELPGGETEGVTSFLPLYNAGVIAECLGKTDEARAFYRRCGGYARAKERLAALGGA